MVCAFFTKARQLHGGNPKLATAIEGKQSEGSR